jgi:4-amino-4-deoxy-L-arabinose transferase-like glycosyltransferase
MDPEKLQQAWQSQPDGTPEINPDQLLKKARLGRRVHFWIDFGSILLLSYIGISMSRTAFHDFQKNWPWLFYVASDVWVVGYILFNRWRRGRKAAHNDEPLLARVESSIKDTEHALWLSRRMIWWQILPMFLGCLIPVFIFGAIEYAKKPDLLIPLTLLLTLVVFAVTFYFCYLVMRYRGPSIEQPCLQELLELRELRESLLDAEE